MNTLLVATLVFVFWTHRSGSVVWEGRADIVENPLVRTEIWSFFHECAAMSVAKREGRTSDDFLGRENWRWTISLIRNKQIRMILTFALISVSETVFLLVGCTET
jgi:hypothetical protein